MQEEDLTLFDIKYTDAMERIDSLFSLAAETNSISIKNYIDFYRLDISQAKPKIIKKVKSNKKNEVKSNQIPKLYVINIQEKKEKQYYNNKYLKNEIDWYEIKKNANEMRIKFNNHLIKQKFENDLFQNKIEKEIEKNNKIIKKNYSNLSNKLNIDKLINKKNENGINNNIMKDYFTLNSHKTSNNRYGQLKLFNKNGINNIIGNNIKVNYSEDIKKKLKLKSDIDNFISQNMKSNNIKKIKIKNADNSNSAEKNKNINPFDKKIYRLAKIEVKKQDNNN